jgi:hypothetical protein
VLKSTLLNRTYQEKSRVALEGLEVNSSIEEKINLVWKTSDFANACLSTCIWKCRCLISRGFVGVFSSYLEVDDAITIILARGMFLLLRRGATSDGPVIYRTTCSNYVCDIVGRRVLEEERTCE